MKGFLRWVFQFVFALVGIALISGLPTLISGIQTKQFLLKEYFDTVKENVVSLFPIQDITISSFASRGQMKEIPLFPNIYEYIAYSLQLLVLALIAAVVIALVLTFFTMMLKEKGRQRVKIVLYFFESIPDILVIMLAQILVIIIYKNTGTLISKIAVIGDERIYWLPVFCLMLLPMIQLYRLSMLTFEAEERLMYVELVRSLGFGKLFILYVHIFRNAIISVFFQSKKTMWFMLSNLFVLELMFNIPGIMLFMWQNVSGKLFLITVFSFFLPIFFLYSIGEWYFLRRFKRGGVAQ